MNKKNVIEGNLVLSQKGFKVYQLPGKKLKIYHGKKFLELKNEKNELTLDRAKNIIEGCVGKKYSYKKYWMQLSSYKKLK